MGPDLGSREDLAELTFVPLAVSTVTYTISASAASDEPTATLTEAKATSIRVADFLTSPD